MMKNKMLGSLVLAATITALTAVSAMAADKPAQPEAEAAQAMTYQVKACAVDANDDALSTDAGAAKMAVYYYDGDLTPEEGNVDVSFTEKDVDFDTMVKGKMMTDENGEQYWLTEDGNKLYISISQPEAVGDGTVNITTTTKTK